MDLTFSGTENPPVEFDKNGNDGKLSIKKFENGEYKNKVIKTKHPNIVNSVIKGKKSWGLHIQLWSDGIIEGTFSLKEIEEDFTNKNIKIPESLYEDFINQIIKRIK